VKGLRRRIEGIHEDPPTLFWPFLVSLSLLYRGLVALHRWFYSSGLARVKRLPRPVVSIGNLTVGGGGKTPLVIWLVEKMASRGIRAVVLSRGYGRRSRRTLLAGPEDDWSLSGDEPVVIARRTRTPVAVARDRYLGGMKALESQEVDIFIMDDGFQHRGLYRDLDIVAVDGLRRFGSGKLLPAGILREPVSRLRDADLVVVTKSAVPDHRFERELKGFKDFPVMWSDFRAAGLVPLGTARGSSFEGALEGKALAFCGIANPQGFRSSLRQAGVRVAGFLAFPDHHPFSVQDVDRIKAAARETGSCCMVTTEKDAVRWPDDDPEIPVYFLSMVTVPLKGEENLIEKVERLALGTGGNN